MGAAGKLTSSCVRYGCGSTSCRRQVLVRLASMDAVRPPRGLPTNSEFLRLWKYFHSRNYVEVRIMVVQQQTARGRAISLVDW
jgi:hypothetical protein